MNTASVRNLMRMKMPRLYGSAPLGSLLIAGLLFATPFAAANAGDRPAYTDGYAPTYETYKGARRFARERARKVCRQERDYRALERKRLARLGIAPPPPWTYASAWGACTARGLF